MSSEPQLSRRRPPNPAATAPAAVTAPALPGLRGGTGGPGGALLRPLARGYGGFLARRLFQPPRRAPHRTPEDVGLSADRLRIPFADGRSVHAWLCHASYDRVVVLGHGLGLSKSAALAHAVFLRDAGYTVCLFDHRNHGASDRDRSRRGLSVRFTADILAVLRHLREVEWYDDARFAVYGFSFSTFPSLYALRDPAARVDAVVCDSGPSLRVRPLYRNFLESGSLPLPAPLRGERARTAVADALAERGEAMLDARAWPPAPRGAHAGTPLLFLAGDQDRIIPSGAVREFAARYPAAEFRELPGAGHLKGLRTDPEGYGRLVLEFLGRSLAAGGSAEDPGE